MWRLMSTRYKMKRWIEIVVFRDCEIGAVREAGTNPVRDSAWIIYRIEVS